MNIPPSFVTSYSLRDSYPTNLVYKGAYSSSLEARRKRLADAAPDLLTNVTSEIAVPFRDLKPDGSAFEKYKVSSDPELRTWLGDQYAVDPLLQAPSGCIATKKDPRCRFIFLLSGHSWNPLFLTLPMFVRIMTYHQVMSAYLDFVSVFGHQERPRDLRFSGFHEQTSLSAPARGLSIPDLGRSGQLYQLCYNLKAPAFREDQQPTWSIRQVAIHHQFDAVYGTTLWIVAKGDDLLKKRIEELTGVQGRDEDRAFTTPQDCFKSSLSVHLLLCSWSTEEWRWYIQFFEDIIDRDTQLAVSGPRDRKHARVEYKSEHVQEVQDYEDKINECIMVIEANVEVLSALLKYYEGLLDRADFPVANDCRDNIAVFSSQLNDMIYDLKMQIARAKLLVRITADRKTMILQHLQAQATEVMEDLTKSMFRLSFMGQKEAIAMRIITVLTLVYLPATFVSTFFSTDVVKYQNNNNDLSNGSNQTSGTSFSLVALETWLEVTLPLTLITIAAAVYFYKKYVKHAELKAGVIDSLPFYYKSLSCSS